MSRRLQKSASFLSLLTYGAIGLLGYGLHYFAPCCDHHAALAVTVPCCGCGDHDCTALAKSKEAESQGGASLRENDHDPRFLLNLRSFNASESKFVFLAATQSRNRTDGPWCARSINSDRRICCLLF